MTLSKHARIRMQQGAECKIATVGHRYQRVVRH